MTRLTERQKRLLAYMADKPDVDSLMALNAIRAQLNRRPCLDDAGEVLRQLVKRGLAERIRQGIYRITPEGRALLAALEAQS